MSLIPPHPPPGDRQWIGGDLVHDRLRRVRRRHDQDCDTARLDSSPNKRCMTSHPSAMASRTVCKASAMRSMPPCVSSPLLEAYADTPYLLHVLVGVLNTVLGEVLG